MKRNAIVIFATLLLIFYFTSCKTSHKTTIGEEYQPTPSSVEKLDKVINAYGEWNTFSANGKVTLDFGKSFSSSMQIKMKKGNYISISIRPMLGIEVAKIYISGDSTFIIDKFHKKYVAEPTSFFQQGFPIGIDDLQNAFLNRLFILGENLTNSKLAKGMEATELQNNILEATPKHQINGFKYSFLINSDNNLKKIKVSPTLQSIPLSISFDNFFSTEKGFIAKSIEISASRGGRNYSLALDLDSSRIKWDGDLSDEMSINSINSNYTRISTRALTSLFEGM